MNFKALLWDMDGSLINSETLYEFSLQQTNQKYNLTLDLSQETLGVSLPDLWEYIPSEQKKGLEYSQWVREIQSYVDAHHHTLTIFEAAQQVIDTAYNRNIPQSCVSNNSKYFIERILTHNQVDRLFHHWIGHEDVNYCKPHPQPYQYSAQLLGMDPSHCLAIEDSAVGVASAKGAGLKVALYCGHEGEPITDQADYVIRCHRELLSLLAS